MPQATLAAVVVFASIDLISPAEFSVILRVRTMEFRWALIALIGVVLLGTLKGILVAVVVSLVGLIIQTNRRPVLILGRKPGTHIFRPLSPENPQDETFPGLLLLKIEGSVHFANSSWLGDLIWPLIHEHRPQVLALDCSAMPDIEYTALKLLTEAEEKLRESGILLCLVALNPEPLRIIQNTPLGKTLGRERMFFSLEQAVEGYRLIAGKLPKGT
jgi:MFS superfamily sulfate permease-like transporter